MNYDNIRLFDFNKVAFRTGIATDVTISDTVDYMTGIIGCVSAGISAEISAEMLSVQDQLDMKYCAEYFPEHSLVADADGNVYRTVKYGKLGEYVFDLKSGEDYVTVYSVRASQNLSGVVVAGTAAGVYISLDGGRTYRAFDEDVKNVTAIREEKNFPSVGELPDAPEHGNKLAFVCADSAGQIYYMIVYLDSSGGLASYTTKLFYITKYYISDTYAAMITNPTASQYSLQTLTGVNPGTVYGIEYVGGRYLFACYNGLYIFYITNAFNMTKINVTDTACYAVQLYGGKYYVAGTNRTIYASEDGLTWKLAYTMTSANNINCFTVFRNTLVGVCQTADIVVFDGTEWKELDIGDYERFNANAATEVYIGKLRESYCYIASSVGILASNDLTAWRLICADDGITGLENQARCIMQHGTNLYIGGGGIAEIVDDDQPLLTLDGANDALSIDYRLSSFLTAGQIAEKYVDKAQISDFMDSVIVTETKTTDSGYKWTFAVDDSVQYIGSTVMTVTSGVLPYNQTEFGGKINGSAATWTQNSMTYTYWSDVVQKIGSYSFSFRFFVVYNAQGAVYDSSGNPIMLSKNEGVVQITSNAPDFSEIIIRATPVEYTDRSVVATKLDTPTAISCAVLSAPVFGAVSSVISSAMFGTSSTDILSSCAFSDQLTSNQYSSTILGARLTLSNYFDDIADKDGKYVNIKSVSLRCHSNTAMTAGVFYARILDQFDRPVGNKSELNPAAAKNTDYKLTFTDPVRIDLDADYYKIVFYDPSTDQIKVDGIAAREKDYSSIDAGRIFGFYVSKTSSTTYGIQMPFDLVASSTHQNIIAGIEYDICSDTETEGQVQNTVNAMNGGYMTSLSGKYVSLIGDSVSTFRYYQPTGYAYTYPLGTSDVSAVEQTWWYPLIQETGMNLLVNASWSGSRVVGGNTLTGTAYTSASNARIQSLSADGITPDIVICLIGINDFGRALTGDVPVGEYDGTTDLPEEGVQTNFADGYATMIYKIRSAYPFAKVYCCSILEGMNTNADPNQGFPVVNAAGTALVTYNAKIEQLAKAFGCEFIDTHACGISYFNRGTTVCSDYIHPTALGMKLIKNYIKSELLRRNIA